jgi:DNA-binding XRE family transcriptional regulator
MRRWSKEAVIREIKARHRKGLSLGYNATIADDEALAGAARRYFGTWYAAVEAAGFDPSDYKFKTERKLSWDRPTILSEIRSYAEQGGNLSAGSVRKHYSRLYSAAVAYFGSWKAALKELGIDYESVRLYQEWTAERVIQEIKDAHGRGADLSDNTVDALRPDLYGAAHTHFGSWRAAVEAAGLDPEKVRRTNTWSREKLIATAQRAYESGITVTQLVEAGFLDAYTIYRHFEGGIEDLNKLIAGEQPEIEIENHLAEVMIARKISQNELAKRINRSRTHIRHIMYSTRTPKLADAMLIARELGCHMEDIWRIK